MINEFDLEDWEMLSEPLPLKQVKNGSIFILEEDKLKRFFFKKGNASCWTNCFPLYETGLGGILGIDPWCKLHYPWDVQVRAYKQKGNV